MTTKECRLGGRTVSCEDVKTVTTAITAIYIPGIYILNRQPCDVNAKIPVSAVQSVGSSSIPRRHLEHGRTN